MKRFFTIALMALMLMACGSKNVETVSNDVDSTAVVVDTMVVDSTAVATDSIITVIDSVAVDSVK
jgi:uncharacterized protein YcfL